MGLYPQPNNWQCGPFALKHALIMLGRIVDEKHASRIADANWWTGADEIKLARAAKAYSCDLPFIRRKTAMGAFHELLSALKKGYPCLLCVENWNHWITVVGAERGKLIYIDSRKHPVVRVATWPRMQRMWVYRETDSRDPTYVGTLYDLHPVVPRFRVRTKARFSLRTARYLRRPENRELAAKWDEYFDDLSAICIPRPPRSQKVFPVGELLRRHGEMIMAQIDFWHGSVRKRHIGKMLRNFRLIADTYDFVVPKSQEKRAIAAITANLTLWAAGKFGVAKVNKK